MRADEIQQRCSQRAALQLITFRLPDDHTELETAWDEICVQIQREKSPYWGAYDETVRGIVDDQIAEVPKHEQEAMWLQTDRGIDWSCKEPDDRDEFPVGGDDIVEWLTAEYVYSAAESCSNARVQAHLERSRKERRISRKICEAKKNGGVNPMTSGRAPSRPLIVPRS